MMKLFALLLLLCCGSLCIKAQEVVINKFCNNQEKDSVELLVIQQRTDMRGMILKDFTRDVNNNLTDSGGIYRFNNAPLWSSVASGTLIVLYRDGSSIDTTTGDFVLKLALNDTRYFEHIRGEFDIRSDGELLILKRAGSPEAWMEGSIHAFACASFSKVIQDTIPKPFLYVTRNAATNKSIIAKNSTRSLADYNGKDGDTTSVFLYGSGNTTQNTAFIDSLRAITAADIPPPDNPFFCHVYPNPAQGEIVVTSGSTILALELFDILGRRILSVTMHEHSSTYLLSLASLQQGIVLLRVHCRGNTHDQLLTIQ